MGGILLALNIGDTGMTVPLLYPLAIGCSPRIHQTRARHCSSG